MDYGYSSFIIVTHLSQSHKHIQIEQHNTKQTAWTSYTPMKPTFPLIPVKQIRQLMLLI